MESYVTYQELVKPSRSPPSSVFGPVRTFLYILIAISFGTVFYKVVKKERPAKVALPFVLNLVFNASFTRFQFGLENNLLAAIDILLVLGTLIWAMITVYPYKKRITYIQIPYLLRVSFATVLQLTITYMNR